MRPPIGFMGPGHQTPACFPTADARILLVLWSDAMYFSSPWRKIPGVPVSKQAPSIGRGLWHCAICSIFICISRQIMIILLS